jgi:small subunit ribosomal protein S16
LYLDNLRKLEQKLLGGIKGVVKIRLMRMGRKKSPFYRVVVAESTSPRDGRFIETIGTYNPGTNPSEIKLDVERARHWISVGAQPTSSTAWMLRSNGIEVKGKIKGEFLDPNKKES